MKNILKLAAVAALTISASAFAATTDTSPVSGLYFGAGMGSGLVNEEVQLSNGSMKKADDDFAYNFNVGYMFTKFVGVEAGYNGFTDVKYANNVKSKDNFNTYLAVKGVYPFENGFNLFGKLGVAYAHTDFDAPANYTKRGSHSAATALVGLGAGYDFTQNFGMNLTLQGTSKSGDVPAMSSLMLGAQYTF